MAYLTYIHLEEGSPKLNEIMTDLTTDQCAEIIAGTVGHGDTGNGIIGEIHLMSNSGPIIGVYVGGGQIYGNPLGDKSDWKAEIYNLFADATHKRGVNYKELFDKAMSIANAHSPKWVVIDVEAKKSWATKYATEAEAKKAILPLWLATLPEDAAAAVGPDGKLPDDFEGMMGYDADVGFYNWEVNPQFNITTCPEGEIGVRGMVADRAYMVVPFPGDGYFGKADPDIYRTTGQDGAVLATEITDEELTKYFPEDE